MIFGDYFETLYNYSGKFLYHKALVAMTFGPKSSPAICVVVSYILKKNVFMLFKVFSGYLNSEIECFRVSRNQRFSLTRTMVGSGIRPFG